MSHILTPSTVCIPAAAAANGKGPRLSLSPHTHSHTICHSPHERSSTKRDARGRDSQGLATTQPTKLTKRLFLLLCQLASLLSRPPLYLFRFSSFHCPFPHEPVHIERQPTFLKFPLSQSLRRPVGFWDSSSSSNVAICPLRVPLRATSGQ